MDDCYIAIVMLYHRVVKEGHIRIFGWIGEAVACGVEFEIEKAAHDVQLGC